MALFTVYAMVTCSAYTIVEAESEEAAREIASGRDVELQFNGSGTDEHETFVIEDADGQPDIQRVEQ